MPDEITFSQLCQTIDLTASTMDNYMYLLHFDLDYFHISEPAITRFQLPAASFHNVKEVLKNVTYPEDRVKIAKELEDIQAGVLLEHNMQYRWLANDGAPVWISCRGTIVRKDGKPVYMVGFVNEIGKMQYADNMSGLLRLTSYAHIFNEIVPKKDTGFLLRLGIDDLRGINARLGLKYGNMVIQQTAECVQKILKPGQAIYRIDGDEFLITSLSDGIYEDAVELYRAIRKQIDSYMKHHQYEVMFSVSGGILMCSDIEDCSYLNVMKLSEFALTMAKNRGRNTYARYSSEAYMLAQRKRTLLVALRQAIYNDFEGFQAYFQPLYRTDGTLVGAETLMRFTSKEFGPVSPAEFIPVLEESGLIIPAGSWIIRQALMMGKQLQTYIPNFMISFNVSYIQFMKINICKEILKAIKEFGISANTVIVELTESGLLESNRYFSSMWHRLRENGVLMALDDFGTGYSNFHYLNDLRPDIIKIDRTFTISAMRNADEYSLLKVLRQLAETLGLALCIEGIETPDEFSQMSQLRPDYCQGYYFGKPCSVSSFMEMFVPR